MNATHFEESDRRFYTIGGKMYPRVTTILDAYPKDERFYKWVAEHGWDEACRIRDKAADGGTKVHLAIGRLLEGEALDFSEFEKYNKREWRKLQAFVDWYETYQPDEITAVELTLHSKRYGYAGTCDLIIVKDETLVLVDFKTGSALHDHFWLQVSAYAKAYAEMKLGKVVQTAILHLGTSHKKKYNYVTHDAAQIETDFSDFLAVKQIFHRTNPKLEPETEIYPLKLQLSRSKDTDPK